MSWLPLAPQDLAREDLTHGRNSVNVDQIHAFKLHNALSYEACNGKVISSFLFLLQLSSLKVLNHSPMSDASVHFDYKSSSPFDRSTDQEEKIEDVASHCLPQKDLYAAEEEAETLFPRKMTSHNGMEDSGGGGTGVKKKRKKKDPGEQEGAAKGSKDREPKPKRKREPREPKEPRKAKEPKRPKEPKEPKQKDGAKKARKPREASGTKEAKEKRSGADSAARTKSKKARCVSRPPCSEPWALPAQNGLPLALLQSPDITLPLSSKVRHSLHLREKDNLNTGPAIFLPYLLE